MGLPTASCPSSFACFFVFGIYSVFLSACAFTAAAVKAGGASEIKINGIYFVFLSACTTFQ